MARYYVEGDKDHPSNKGILCSKGMNLHYAVNDKSDRLLFPQMRFNPDMPLQRVSRDVALDRIAAISQNFIQKYGPDSVGFYVSGQCSTEEYYIINKLVTRLYLWNSRMGAISQTARRPIYGG